MLETDITVWVLTPLNLEYPIWCLNVLPRHLQWLSMVDMIKTDMSACVLTCFVFYGDLQGQKLIKKCQNVNFDRIIQSGSLTLYRDIFNDYLWSHIIKSDMPACVLTWIGVYGDLQGNKLVKKCQKCQFWSLNPNYLIWCLNIVPRHL